MQIQTPTIGDLSNMNHNHSASGASGGTIANITGNAATVTGLSVTGGKTLTVSDSATIATNAITLAGGEVITFTASNALTLTTTGTTVMTFPAATDTVVTLAATQHLTNKRSDPKIGGTTSSSTPTPNADTDDLYDLTALAVGATFGAPTGTPVNGQKIIIRIKDNGTAQTLAFNSGAGGYVAGGVALPTTTVISKILTLGFMYNTANSLNKWCLIASAQEA